MRDQIVLALADNISVADGLCSGHVTGHGQPQAIDGLLEF